MILSSAPAREPVNDPIALVLVLCVLLAFVVYVLIKNAKKKKAAAAVETVKEIPVAAPEAPGSAGQLKLHSVEPKTAAMLMAIVADKMGKPLNELRFISIKEVE